MADFALDHSLRARWIREGERWSFEMPSGWMQGRSVYGGLSGAAALALARRVVGPGRVARQVNLSLLRPLVPGPTWGRAEVLREGRSVTVASVELGQGDAVGLRGEVTFAQPRPGGLVVEAEPCVPDPDEAPRVFPYVPGLTPEFIQQVELRLVRGELPFSGGAEAELVGECRFRVPAGDEEGLLALVDVWPCPSLARLTGPAPASTVTWSTHLLAAPEHQTGYYRYHYRTVAGAGGFHTARGELYAPDGPLVAVSEQLVAVFEGPG